MRKYNFQCHCSCLKSLKITNPLKLDLIKSVKCEDWKTF